ncbi:MAG: hypothetical protein ACRYG5_13400 [Janthinobacterium lividum]
MALTVAQSTLPSSALPLTPEPGHTTAQAEQPDTVEAPPQNCSLKTGCVLEKFCAESPAMRGSIEAQPIYAAQSDYWPAVCAASMPAPLRANGVQKKVLRQYHLASQIEQIDTLLDYWPAPAWIGDVRELALQTFGASANFSSNELRQLDHRVRTASRLLYRGGKPTPLERWQHWSDDERLLRALEAEIWSHTSHHARLRDRAQLHLPADQVAWLRNEAGRLFSVLRAGSARLDPLRIEYLYEGLCEAIDLHHLCELPDDPWFYYRAMLTWRLATPAPQWLPGAASLDFYDEELKISAALLDAQRRHGEPFSTARDEQGLLSIRKLLAEFDRRLVLFADVSRLFNERFEAPAALVNGTTITGDGKVWSSVSFDGQVFRNANGWSPMRIASWLPPSLAQAPDALAAVRNTCLRRNIGVLTSIGTVQHSIESTLLRLARSKHLPSIPPAHTVADLNDAFTRNLCAADGHGADAARAFVTLGRHLLAAREGFIASVADMKRFIRQTAVPIFNRASVNSGFDATHESPARYLNRLLGDAKDDFRTIFAALADEAAQDDLPPFPRIDGLGGLGFYSHWMGVERDAVNAIRACAREALRAPWHRDVLVSPSAVDAQRNLLVYGFYAWYAKGCRPPAPYDEGDGAYAALRRLGVTDEQLLRENRYTLYMDTASPVGISRRGTLLDEYVWRMRAHDLRSVVMLLPATAERPALSIRPADERRKQLKIYARDFIGDLCVTAQGAEQVRRADRPPSDVTLREKVLEALASHLPEERGAGFDPSELLVPGLGAAWVLYKGLRQGDPVVIETGVWHLLMSLIPFLPEEMTSGAVTLSDGMQAELESAAGADTAADVEIVVTGEDDVIGSAEDLYLRMQYTGNLARRRPLMSAQMLTSATENFDRLALDSAGQVGIPPRFRDLAEWARRGSSISYKSDRIANIEGESVARLRHVGGNVYAQVDWEDGLPVQGVPLVEFSSDLDIFRRMRRSSSIASGSAEAVSHGRSGSDGTLRQYLPYLSVPDHDETRARNVFKRSFSVDLRERYPEMWRRLSVVVDHSAEVRMIINAFDDKFYAASQYPSIIEHVVAPLISQLLVKSKGHRALKELTLSTENMRNLLFEEQVLDTIVGLMDGVVNDSGRSDVTRTLSTALVDRAVSSLGMDVAPRISSWVFNNATLAPLWSDPLITDAQRTALAHAALAQDIWIDQQLAPFMPPVAGTDEVLGVKLAHRLTVKGVQRAYRLIDAVPAEAVARSVEFEQLLQRYLNYSDDIDADWAIKGAEMMEQSMLLRRAFAYWHSRQGTATSWRIHIRKVADKAPGYVDEIGYHVDYRFQQIYIYDDACRYAAARGLRTMTAPRKFALAFLEAFLGSADDVLRNDADTLRSFPAGLKERGWPVVLAEAALRQLGQTVYPQIAAHCVLLGSDAARAVMASLTPARRAAEKEDAFLRQGAAVQTLE